MAALVFPVLGYQGQVLPHWGRQAGGADLFARAGTPVLSMTDGRVSSAGFNNIGGNYALIQGNDGNQYYYAHMQSPPAVSAGQLVSAGAQIGAVGDTGNARGTGYHLHIGIGPEIVSGGGPLGGIGRNFDAVSLLKQSLEGIPDRPIQDEPLPVPGGIPERPPADEPVGGKEVAQQSNDEGAASELAARRYAEEFKVGLDQARVLLQLPANAAYKEAALGMARAGQLDYLLSPGQGGPRPAPAAPGAPQFQDYAATTPFGPGPRGPYAAPQEPYAARGTPPAAASYPAGIPLGLGELGQKYATAPAAAIDDATKPPGPFARWGIDGRTGNYMWLDSYDRPYNLKDVLDRTPGAEEQLAQWQQNPWHTVQGPAGPWRDAQGQLRDVRGGLIQEELPPTVGPVPTTATPSAVPQTPAVPRTPAAWGGGAGGGNMLDTLLALVLMQSLGFAPPRQFVSDTLGRQGISLPTPQQPAQDLTVAPIGPQNRQAPRQLPQWLLRVPSTQLYGAWSPAERTGFSLLGQGLGIPQEDLADQILRGAPPAGQSVQSFLQPSVVRFR